ncbi:ferric-chelate reductase 1-like [Watersipora subatra]|uniref:ferric-chelate reductase 1-like n=1 Tax=Watersipora subatra TaxID=2589382 RepID=UPI00355B1AA6
MVTLRGASFKGFLVMALPENDDIASPVGTFGVAQNADGNNLNQDKCTGGSTHTNDFSGSFPVKDYIEFPWMAPNTPPVNIIFYATFVQTTSTYWVKLPSSVVTPPEDSTTPPITSTPSVTSRAATVNSPVTTSSSTSASTTSRNPESSSSTPSITSTTTESTKAITAGMTSFNDSLHSDACSTRKLTFATCLLHLLALLVIHP